MLDIREVGVASGYCDRSYRLPARVSRAAVSCRQVKYLVAVEGALARGFIALERRVGLDP